MTLDSARIDRAALKAQKATIWELICSRRTDQDEKRHLEGTLSLLDAIDDALTSSDATPRPLPAVTAAKQPFPAGRWTPKPQTQ